MFLENSNNSLGQSLEEITPKETEPVVQQEEVPLTVVPSSTSTAAESLASENSAATSAGSSQETVQPAQNQILLLNKSQTATEWKNVKL